MINSHPLCLLSYRGTEQLAVAGMCLGDLGLGVKRFLMLWGNFLRGKERAGERQRGEGARWGRQKRGGSWAAEGRRVGRGVLPPWNVEHCPTAPGARLLKNLPVFRWQDQSLVPLKSRPSLAALPASLSLLCVS